MKKILILKGKSGKEDALIEYLKEKLEADCQITVGKWPEVIFEIEPGKVKPFLGKEPILGFDLVLFRRTERKFHYLAKVLALVLDYYGIKYLDTAWGENKIGEKLLSHVSLALASLPVIPSLGCLGKKILIFGERAVNKFGFPLVVKETKKGLGRGVFLLKNQQDIENFSQKVSDDDILLFQKFYPNDGDFRILVLGEKVAVWEKRTRKKEEFRNNVALGATEEFFPVEKVPPEIAEISVKAARTLKLEMAGVDVLMDKTGRPWILEVNRQPNFTADLKISPELPVVASFIKEILAKKNEGSPEEI